MKDSYNISSRQKIGIMSVLLVLLGLVIWVILTDPLGVEGTDNSQKTLVQKTAAKEPESLEKYLNFSLPANWNKSEQFDSKSAKSLGLTLTSSDFEASDSAKVKNGIKVSIKRSTDSNSEETVKNKITATYPVSIYNVLGLKIGEKNAVTMHGDSEGHSRLIYVADGVYLWQILISTKSIEDEEKNRDVINKFLEAIRFKS